MLEKLKNALIQYLKLANLNCPYFNTSTFQNWDQNSFWPYGPTLLLNTIYSFCRHKVHLPSQFLYITTDHVEVVRMFPSWRQFQRDFTVLNWTIHSFTSYGHFYTDTFTFSHFHWLDLTKTKTEWLSDRLTILDCRAASTPKTSPHVKRHKLSLLFTSLAILIRVIRVIWVIRIIRVNRVIRVIKGYQGHNGHQGHQGHHDHQYPQSPESHQ